MDKKFYELLRDVNSHSDRIRDWEEVTSIFVNSIKRKGLSREQDEELNERILKEVEKGKKDNIYKVADKEVVRKAMRNCSEKYNNALKNLTDK